LPPLVHIGTILVLGDADVKQPEARASSRTGSPARRL
jgi:hypothetical protein